MPSLSQSMQRLLTLLVALAGLAALALPVKAQEAPTPQADAWQMVITGQVQAFRDRDAPVALSFAGQGFQTAFASPEAFFVSIMASGYSPIMESRSHSFGDFQLMEPKRVAQIVNFVGPSQELYRAVYVLALEQSGWRVQGVQLVKTAAVGI